uniref:F-box domain-containing protein n=1 Tax=Arundo donax TaxID=35708 RepID=A0A0A8YL96_ARUDO
MQSYRGVIWTEGTQTSSFTSCPWCVVDILHKILSPLTFKEIVQTSILCTQWRNVWRSYPDLRFSRDTLNFMSYIPLNIDDEAEFVKRINDIIEHHHCPRLDMFKVSFGLQRGHKDHLDRWIGFAVDSKSKSIVLNLTPVPECLEDTFVFPLHLFPGA